MLIKLSNLSFGFKIISVLAFSLVLTYSLSYTQNMIQLV